MNYHSNPSVIPLEGLQERRISRRIAGETIANLHSSSPNPLHIPGELPIGGVLSERKKWDILCDLSESPQGHLP